jgi:hypothetical protein
MVKTLIKPIRLKHLSKQMVKTRVFTWRLKQSAFETLWVLVFSDSGKNPGTLSVAFHCWEDEECVQSLVETPHRKHIFWRPHRWWTCNIKIVLRARGCRVGGIYSSLTPNIGFCYWRSWKFGVLLLLYSFWIRVQSFLCGNRVVFL